MQCIRAAVRRSRVRSRKNRDRAIVGTAQAVPSIAPASASGYLRKTECFCFTPQTLRAGRGARDAGALHRRSEPAGDVDRITLRIHFLRRRPDRASEGSQRRRTRRTDLLHVDKTGTRHGPRPRPHDAAGRLLRPARQPVADHRLGRAVHHDGRRRRALAQRRRLGPWSCSSRLAACSRSCSSAGSAT